MGWDCIQKIRDLYTEAYLSKHELGWSTENNLYLPSMILLTEVFSSWNYTKHNKITCQCIASYTLWMVIKMCIILYLIYLLSSKRKSSCISDYASSKHTSRKVTEIAAKGNRPGQ